MQNATLQRHAASVGSLARIEAALRVLIELPTALLVLVEILVLLAGVISRFGLHRPLVWSDELASILFLWLAMLGAAVAMLRGHHMRLTAVVAMLPPAGQRLAAVLAEAVPAAFLLVLMPYAWDYAQDEAFIETPALGLSNIVRAAALPVGGALMLAMVALRLCRLPPRDVLFGFVLLAGLAAAAWLGAPWLKSIGNWNLLVFFVLLLAGFVLMGVPIGFAFGTATLAFLATVTRTPLRVWGK